MRVLGPTGMGRPAVAAFTDTYLPTVNGVTYTVRSWRDCWRARGGRMAVVYPRSDHEPGGDEHPVSSLPFPFYEGFRLGSPQVPDAVTDVELVHAHTPFAVGLAGLRLARREGLPLVTTFHTPTSEYAGYISEGWLADAVARVGNAYERWFLRRADRVIAPSERARDALVEAGVGPVSVVHNGVDTDRFAPTEDGFRERYDLGDGPLVGYTGRHGFEKQLHELVDACAGLDVTLVFGGDGPAREALEGRAAERDVDARFLGFLDRAELPGFYSALDAFGFPSPVETEGLVALESIACGTPVAAAAAGALVDTVDDGRTGYHYESGDVEGFRAAIRRVLDERDRLHERCLAERESMGLDHAVDRLEQVYGEVADRRARQ
jgi:glycosyltransferase involved in cell wall biosynthesis